MTEAKVVITAEDHASGIIDHISKKLGIFNKQGIAMGISFAAINMGIQLTQQAIQDMIDYVQKGIEMTRKFELSMVYLKNSFQSLGKDTIDTVAEKIRYMGIMFGTSASEMADNLHILAQEGYNATEAISMLYNISMLAKVANESVASSAEAATIVLDIFGYSYKSTSRIVEKFNDLTNNTLLTLPEIYNILSQNSTIIRESGLSFDELADLIYTLSEEGTKTGRAISSNLKTALESLDTVVVDSIPNVDDLKESWEELADTASGRAKIIKAAYEDTQMDIGGGLDIGGWFDEQKWNAATKAVKELKEESIDTLEEFKTWNENWLNHIAIFGLSSSTRKIVASIIQHNEAQAKNNKLTEEANIEDATTDYDNLIKSIDSTTLSLETSNNTMLGYQQTIDGLNADIAKATAIHTLNNDLHYIDLALNDASYTTKIFDTSIQALVDSIKIQRDEIQELEDQNDRYSLSSQKNSLAIMQIQYNAMGRRRGMTRGEKKQIEELEKLELGLRIKTMQNQIAIEGIKQGGLTDDERKLEEKKVNLNEELYIIQDAYNQEILALQKKIVDEQIELNKEKAIVTKHVNSLIALYKKRDIAEAGGVSANIESSPDFIGPRRSTYIPRIASGGYIDRTGLAIVHRGETVIPANHNTSNNINVTVNAVINHDIDLNTLGKKVAHAISKGLINNNATPIARMR